MALIGRDGKDATPGDPGGEVAMSAILLITLTFPSLVWLCRTIRQYYLRRASIGSTRRREREVKIYALPNVGTDTGPDETGDQGKKGNGM